MHGLINKGEIRQATDAMQWIVDGQSVADEMEAIKGWGSNVMLEISIASPQTNSPMQVPSVCTRNLTEAQVMQIIDILIAAQNQQTAERAKAVYEDYGIGIEGLSVDNS